MPDELHHAEAEPIHTEVCLAFPVKVIGDNKQDKVICVRERVGFNQYSATVEPLVGLDVRDRRKFQKVETVEYRVPKELEIKVFTAARTEEAGESDGQQNVVRNFFVDKIGGGNGLDFRVRLQREKGEEPVDVNGYTLLRLIQLGGYFETDFTAGERAEQQEIVFPIPNPSGGLDLLIFHPHLRKDIVEGEPIIAERGKDAFKAQIVDLLVGFIEADENTSDTSDKLGLLEVFQNYKPETNGLGLKSYFKKQTDDLKRYITADLEAVAGLFANTLFETDRVKDQLAQELKANNFQPLVDSSWLYPRSWIRSLTSEARKEMEATEAGLMAQLAGHETRVAKLTERIERAIQRKAELEDSIDTLNQSIGDLRAEETKLASEWQRLLAEKQERNRQASVEVDALRRQYEEMMTQIQVERAKLESEVAAGRQELARLIGERARLAAQTAAVESGQSPITNLGKYDVLVVTDTDLSGRPVVSDGWFLSGYDPDGKAILVKYIPNEDLATFARKSVGIDELERLNKPDFTPSDIRSARSVAELIYIINRIPEEQLVVTTDDGTRQLLLKRYFMDDIENIIDGRGKMSDVTREFGIRDTLENILRETEPAVYEKVGGYSEKYDSSPCDLLFQRLYDAPEHRVDNQDTRDVVNYIRGISKRLENYARTGEFVEPAKLLSQRTASIGAITTGTWRDNINPRKEAVEAFIETYGLEIVKGYFGDNIMALCKRAGE